MSDRKTVVGIGPVLTILAGLAWTLQYLWSVHADARHEDTALSLIGPLALIICFLGVWCAVQAVWLSWSQGSEESHGLDDKKRWHLLIGFALFLPSLQLLGFLITCPLYLVLMSATLGMRRPALLASSAVGLGLLIYFGVYTILGIDIPLGPGLLR